MSFYNSFFRNLCRNRLHTFINLIGLSLSLAVVMLLSVYIISECRVNTRYPDVKNLYLMVKDNRSAVLPGKMLASLKQEIPGIADATMWHCNTTTIDADNRNVNYLAVDTSFFRMFDISLVAGNISGFENMGVGVQLITESLAKKIIGHEKLDLDTLHKNNFFKDVSGILADPDLSSGFKYDMIVPRSQWTGAQHCGNNGCDYVYAGAVLLDDKADPELVQVSINKMMDKYRDVVIYGEVKLEPIDKVYFDTSLKDDYMTHANLAMIRLMIFITMAVLLLALLNYINLTSARNLSRLGEVGIKKTFGADTGSVFNQFLTETYQLLSVSVLLALLFALILKPSFDVILGKTLSFSVLYDSVSSVILFIVAFILLGWFVGAVPAWSAARISPILLMKKRFSHSGGMIFRQIFNVLQFTISIVLIISLLMVYKQVDYVKHKSLGFNQEQLLKINSIVYGFFRDPLKQTLLANPSITNISYSYGAPGNIVGVATFAEGEECHYIFADTCFLQTLGIKLIKGKNLSEENPEGVLINETLYKSGGGGDLDTFRLERNVCGVFSDFNGKDLHYAVSPTQIRLSSSEFTSPNTINVRLNTTDVQAALDFIKKTMASFGVNSFDYIFYDDLFNDMYKQEENEAKAIRIFTVLALLISCMGMFGLAEFHTRRRIKEIGIRRVNGATVSEILLHLNWQFLVPVLIAFVIACPIGWYVMDRWLQRFAYRADMSWWIFALAGLVAFTVALITVSWQSWRAATRNPVDSLHHE